MKIESLILTIDNNFNFAIELLKKNIDLTQDDSIINGYLQNATIVSENYIYKNNEVIKLGAKLDSFHKRSQYGFKVINTEYVLIMLDDFLIIKTANSSKIQDIIKKISPSYIRLNNNPNNGKAIFGQEPFKITLTSDRYQINTQPSIWKTDTAKAIFDEEITPWILETYYQYKYSNILGTTLSVSQDIMTSIELIKKGKVKPICCRYFKIQTLNLESIGILAELRSFVKNRINKIYLKFR